MRKFFPYLCIIIVTLTIFMHTGCSPKSDDIIDQGYTQVETIENSSSFEVSPIVYMILSVIVVLAIVIILLPVKIWLMVISSGYWVWPHSLIAMRLQQIELPLVVENFLAARKAGIRISIFEYEALYLAKADVEKITNAMIIAHNGRIDVTIQELKAHYLAGGDVVNTIRAIVSAKNADLKLPEGEKLDLSFDKASSINLAGVNVAEAVESYVKPKVIETERITAVSKDGIELTARVRVTIRVNLDRIISGADEETVIATTNEAVVTIIGQSASHREILENAYEVGEKVLRQKDVIYQDLAYDILSVDISEVEVGKDVRSHLEEEKAKAKLAAEKAREQEMLTRAAEANVHRILAESEVQQAMAEAFRGGNISIQEYHKMMNTEADTDMRKSFANSTISDAKKLDALNNKLPD